MRRQTAGGLLALALLVPSLGWTGANDPMTLQPQSRLWVEGSSTVRGFECKAGKLDAAVEAATPEAVGVVLSGSKGIRSVAVTVPAGKLDCGNGTMNGHMYKAIKADAHPNIVFSLAAYELAKAGEGVTVKLTGKLSLGGVEKPITLTAKATQGPGGTLQVTGTHELRMTEFGLKPPTLMMGTMKVDETVKIGFELFLKA